MINTQDPLDLALERLARAVRLRITSSSIDLPIKAHVASANILAAKDLSMISVGDVKNGIQDHRRDRPELERASFEQTVAMGDESLAEIPQDEREASVSPSVTPDCAQSFAESSFVRFLRRVPLVGRIFGRLN